MYEHAESMAKTFAALVFDRYSGALFFAGMDGRVRQAAVLIVGAVNGKKIASTSMSWTT
jgi:hypothetical protein